jgi:hypothetical protein
LAGKFQKNFRRVEMKKLFSVLVVVMVLVFSTTILFAEEKEKKESAIEVSVGVDFFSAYMGNLSGAEFHDDIVIQPSITMSHKKSGVYFSAWQSYSPRGGIHSDNGGNETDFYLGIAKEIGPVSIDAYYAFYDVYKLGFWGQGDVHALGVKAEWPINKIVTPYVAGECNYVIGQDGQDGFMYKGGVKLNLHKYIKADIAFGGHGEIYGTRSEAISYGRITISTPFEWKGIGITPEISFQKRLGYAISDDEDEGKGGLAKDKVWWGIRFTYAF